LTSKAKPQNQFKKDDTAKGVDIFAFDTDPVAKNYLPEGFKSTDEFLEDMRDEYNKDFDFDRENRNQALEDKKFYAGEQWDPVVLEQRKGLPCLVINSVPQFVAQLVGDWRENKRAIKVLPSENGDKDKADIRADLIRSIEAKSHADRVYDNTFESAAICGDGAFRVAVEYAKDDVFDQDIYIRPIDDSLSVLWDRLSVDPTGRDARHCFVDDLIPLKDFERKWPDASPSMLSARVYNQMLSERWIEPDGIRITEYWRLVDRNKMLCLFEDGSIRFLDGDLDELVQKHGNPVKTRIAPCTYAQMHLVTGYEILSGPYEYRLNRLPIIRMTGRVVNIAGIKIRYGLVRYMKDSVRLRNFWRSVAAEQLGYAPKAQWIATESAVEGYEDELRRAHLTRDPLLKVSDEAIIGQNIQRLDPPVMQTALHNEALVNVQDMKDVTGIQDASLGIKSNETSGKAISARQREGDVASVTYYDNGNAAVLEAGDVANQLISQIYDGTRIVRIIGEDEKVKFLRINDPNDPKSPDLSVGQYDVALSTGSNYTTRRVEAAQAMMDAVQVWPQLMSVAGDLVAKAQDWPGAEELAERLQKTIPQQFLDEDEKTQPDPEVQQLQQAMAMLQHENQQLKESKDIDYKKLTIDIYKAETERIRALSDNMVDGNELELKALGQIVDTGLKLQDGSQKAGDQQHQQQMDQRKQDLAEVSADRAHQTNTAALRQKAGSQSPNSIGQ
jgi:hypothetical protein